MPPHTQVLRLPICTFVCPLFPARNPKLAFPAGKHDNLQMWSFKHKSFLHDLKHQRERPLVKRRGCDMPGCDALGEYRAPRSPDALNSYYWFCLDHVRDYNQNWDYFKDKTPAEIQRQMHNTATWDRPTWRMAPDNGRGGGDAYIRQRIYAHFTSEGVAGAFAMGGEKEEDTKADLPFADTTHPVVEALAVMELALPAEWDGIKAQYKKLAKQYHPDTNTAPEAEEQFKKITMAYNILKLSYRKQVQDDGGTL